MRVLQVLGNLGYGGIETFLMNVYRHIDSDKIQFDFLVRSDNNGDKVQKIELMGGKVFFSPTFTKRPISNYCFVKKFFKEHSKEYDAIHVHCNSFIYPLPVVLGHKYDVKPIILHSHNTCNHGKAVTAYHKFNEKKYDKYIDYRFACSEEAGKWMFDNKPFSVIHNGIDLNSFRINNEKKAEFRLNTELSADDLVIGHVGRFAEQKNHEFIIDIFTELHKKNNKYKLLLIGDGELKKSIENKVNKAGLTDSVIFTGNINNVQDYMQTMDLFVLPSRYEGLPIVGIEAQACGLPCVFSSSITEELKVTENAEFVSLDDKDKWIETIGKMILIPKSDNARQIREAGYDIKETAEKLKEIYLGK